MSKVPRKLPTQNRGSAMIANKLPDPALTRVPEPHPIISCIANPKMAAAAIIEIEIGAIAPIKVPGADAINGCIAMAVSPIASSWAIMPRPSLSKMKRRHGPAKPNPERSKLKPIRRPRPSNNRKTNARKYCERRKHTN